MNHSNRYDQGRDDMRQRPQQQYGGGQNRFQSDDDYNQDTRGGRYSQEFYPGQENPQQNRFDQNDWQERESRGYRTQRGGQQDWNRNSPGQDYGRNQNFGQDYGRPYGQDQGRNFAPSQDYGHNFGGQQGYGGGYGMGQGGRDWQSGMNQGGRDWQAGRSGTDWNQGSRGGFGRESELGNFQGYGSTEHRAYEDSSMRGGSYGQNFGGQNFGSAGYGNQGFGNQGLGSQTGQQRRGPKGYTRSDERIKEDVCERLSQRADLDVEEVTIEVRSGTVTLEGSVPERRMKHMIEDIASGCMGVQEVDNKLRLTHKRSESRSSNTTGSNPATSSSGNKGRKE